MFIHEEAKFLYNNGFINEGEDLPPSKQIVKDLKRFYSTLSGALPRRNNVKRNVNLDQVHRGVSEYSSKK